MPRYAVGAEPPDHTLHRICLVGLQAAGLQDCRLARLTRGKHTHSSSKRVALGMALVLLPHPDRTFPWRGIRRNFSGGGGPCPAGGGGGGLGAGM